jgi:hypothetical protein
VGRRRPAIRANDYYWEGAHRDQAACLCEFAFAETPAAFEKEAVTIGVERWI